MQHLKKMLIGGGNRRVARPNRWSMREVARQAAEAAITAGYGMYGGARGPFQSPAPSQGNRKRYKRDYSYKPVSTKYVARGSQAAPRTRRVKKTKSKKKKTLKQEVARLKKMMPVTTFTKKFLEYAGAGTSVNAPGYLIKNFITSTVLGNNVDKIPYVDPAGASAVLEADLGLASGPKTQVWESGYGKVCFKNNYENPVHVIVWECSPKSDTSSPPDADIDIFDDQFTNSTFSGTLTDKISGFPTDNPYFVKKWNTKKLVDQVLRAGDEASAIITTDFVKVSPQEVAQRGTYARGHGKVFLARLAGTIAHDSSSVGLVGISDSRVDLSCYFRYTYKFDGQGQGPLMEYEESFGAITSAVQAGPTVDPALT